ncbi:MAG: hypothetical protein IPG01_11540 [Chitinophagaceae bacterium]|nr:hypothetical protein [Chitinophagaceae bacterium]
MTFSEKHLQPHVFFGQLTFDEYCSNIPEFYFKKEVPNDVIRNFEVVEKLLALSYYEYKLIDEAYAKAIHTFEMSMNIRLRDFNPKTRNQTFKPLISRLTNLNLFDTDLQTLKHLEFMRNHYSHPQRHSYGGIMVWNRIEFINRIINEMYEDVNLRLERTKLFEQFNKQIFGAEIDKYLVMENQGEKIVLFSLHLVLVNNKELPPSYLVVCKPLFDFETNEGGSINAPFVFESKLVNPLFSKKSLTGESYSSKQKVIFSSISQHKELLPIFHKWQSGYEKKDNKFLFEASSDNYVSLIYVSEMRKFQKM